MYFFLSTAVSENTVYYSYFLININLHLDQEVYDFTDPNTDDIAVPEQGDAPIGSIISLRRQVKLSARMFHSPLGKGPISGNLPSPIRFLYVCGF